MQSLASSLVAAGFALMFTACVTVNGPGAGDGGASADLDTTDDGVGPATGAATSAPDAGAGKGPSGNGGGTGSGGGVDSGLSTCPVAVRSSDIVQVHPPKDGTQGACTDAELATVTGTFASILAAVSPTCAGCLFTESTDVTNSQFFIWADSQHVGATANFGACFGSPYAGGSAECGKVAEELESCLDTACPRSETGSTLCSDATDQQCVSTALTGACRSYNAAQSSACGGATTLQTLFRNCFDSNGGIGPSLRLLCGPP